MYQKQHPETIQKMFGYIATRYDRTNAILSLGMHTYWNHALIKRFATHATVLDLCAGTGAIAKGVLKQNASAHVTLLDFCEQMLQVASHKMTSFADRFETVQADAQKIPLPDASVEGITLAYGIRNIQDPQKCFQEAHRVLVPGGLFGILELTRPRNPLIRWGHHAYLRLLPIMGKCVARHSPAYAYLAQSVLHFTAPETLQQGLYSAGFSKVERQPLMNGVATILWAHK